LPVVIDDTPDASARVPDRFRERQWSRLPGGENAPAFAERARRLLASEGANVAAAPERVVARRDPTPSVAKSGVLKWLVAGLGAVAVAAFAVFVALRTPPKETTVTPVAIPVTPSIPAAPKIDQSSVAVLPFTNLSDDKSNEYFSDGISEELLSVLQQIPGLRVAARLSAFSFKGANATAQEIGEKLGVAHLVEGSVRKSGKSVRLTVRLTRAATGDQLWSESYTRNVKDMFAVQSELAQTVVEQLRGQLGGGLDASTKAELKAQVQAAGKGGTKNADAYQLYLQGTFFLNQFSLDTAIRAADFLQRAVERDSKFALAWAALSRAGSVRGGYGATRRDVDEGFALARRAAARALELQPELAAGHLARVTVLLWYDFDWKGAAESLRRAERVAPTDPDVLAAAANVAYTFGQSEKAVDLAGRAVSLDPVNAEMRIVSGFSLEGAGRYDDAIAEFQRAIELSRTTAWGYAGVGMMRLRQERFDEALRQAEQESNEWSRLCVQAQALWALQRKDEADAALARLIATFADTAAYQIAEVYAYRRENDRAFEWLERAYRQRDAGLAWTRSDRSLARVHDDSRWPAFLKRVGLADGQLK